MINTYHIKENSRFKALLNRDGKLSYKANKHLLREYKRVIRHEAQNNATLLKKVLFENTKDEIKAEKLLIETSKIIQKEELKQIDCSGYNEDIEQMEI